jgi:alpha-1,2-glucosyltransferase
MLLREEGTGAAIARHVINLGLASWTFKMVQDRVPLPYLDEIFHIPQAQKYCMGEFSNWDPKITTPPGLYLIGYLHSYLFKIFSPDPDTFCSIKTLRHANLIGLIAFLPLAVVMIKKNLSTADAICSFPLLAFFGFLYYTDVWSTVFILAAMAVGLKESVYTNVLSAVFAGTSILFRQTNVVWAAFVAVYLLHPKKLVDKNNFVEDILQLVQRAVTTPSITIPYGLVGASFLAFVQFNGGIALGDKSNHVAGVNIPQLFYASLFFLFFSWPIWLSPTFIRRYFNFHFRSPMGLAKYILACAVIAGIIEKLTIIHPFILADNRHYTFYIWRRLISPSYHEQAKFLMVPIYHLGIWTFITTLYQTSPTSWVLTTTLIGAISATLVPSPLFEARYYIIPYIVWRLLQGRIDPRREWAEWIWYTLINLSTFYVFFNYGFKWPGYDDEIMRFMW